MKFRRGVRAYLLGPPSYLLGPPSYLMDPPSYLVDPPSYLVDPPSYLVDPPSYLMDPPSYLSGPPSYLLESLAHQAPSPSYLAGPPAYLVHPSSYLLNAFKSRQRLWTCCGLGVTHRSSDGKPLTYDCLDRWSGNPKLKDVPRQAFLGAMRCRKENVFQRAYAASMSVVQSPALARPQPNPVFSGVRGTFPSSGHAHDDSPGGSRELSWKVVRSI